jgi:hypothetical protein
MHSDRLIPSLRATLSIAATSSGDTRTGIMEYDPEPLGLLRRTFSARPGGLAAFAITYSLRLTTTL